MKLEIKSLNKSYDNNTVLEDISYTFESGKIYGLLGRNGAGKTTLLNAINGSIDINSGEILLDNKEISSSDIGFVTTEVKVPEFLTAREFLQFFLDINKGKIPNIKSIDEYFSIVKIDDKDKDRLMKDYSQGMKSKMQILVNIIASPKIILLDEPLTALDIVVQEDMKNLFRNLKKDHILIFSTHILELATDLCDDIVIINDKKLTEIKSKNLDTKLERQKIIDILRDKKHA